MDHSAVIKSVGRIVGTVSVVYVLFTVVVFLRQRSMLYFPSHDTPETQLNPWRNAGNVIGFCREVPDPRTIWLMMHGNAGQAADRDYVLPCLAPTDSLYVLEYPGYGSRPGKPSGLSMNRAAAEAYQLLRASHPDTPVCVLGESIGSGPACTLAAVQPPPEKIILLMPFDSLSKVAADKFSFLPVKLLLRDRWENLDALRHYTGAVDIFAAREDTIIPIAHARALAQGVPQARLIELPGGHNGWANSDQVKIQR